MKKSVVSGMLSALAVFGPAHGAMSAIEEIVVTAQHRDQSVQDFAGSVSAFSGDTLAEYQIQNVQDLQGMLSNVTLANTGALASGALVAVIRGIGTEPGLSPGVGVYIDSLYLPTPRGSILDLHDVERIEVLKGPQGTLYGRNTIGGAIKYITRDPSAAFEGRLSLGAGSRNLREASVSLSGPLIQDRLYGNLSLLRRDRDGWQDNIATGESDAFAEDDTWTRRLKLVWDITPDLRAKLTYENALERGRPQVPVRVAIPDTLASIHRLQNLAPSFSGGAIQGLGQPLDTYLPSSPNEANTLGIPAYEGRFKQEDDYALFSVEWDVTDRFSIQSHTGYTKNSTRTGIDFDGSALTYIHADQHYRYESYSQEFQFFWSGDRSDVVAGVYYMSLEDNYATDTETSEFVRLSQRRSTLGRPADDRETTLAAYVNWEYDLTDRTRLTLGGRYSQEKAEIDNGETVVDHTIPFIRFSGIPSTSPFAGLEGQPIPILDTPVNIATAQAVVAGLPAGVFGSGQVFYGLPLTSTEYPRQGSKTWTNFSPKIALSHELTPDHMIYGSVSTAFKSGGFNSRTATTTTQSFNPEEVIAYAAGIKSRWPNAGVVLNAEVFYSDYKDKQLNTTFYDPVTMVLDSITRNVGEAEISGFDAEFTWSTPVPGLRFNANLGYLRSEIKKFEQDTLGGGIIDVARHYELAYSPKWSGNVGVRYQHTIETGALIFNANAAYRSDSWLISPTDKRNAFQTDNTRYESHTLVNAGIAYEHGDRFRIALEGRNLTDKRVLVSAFDAFFISGAYNEPRSWALKFDYYL